MTRLPTGDLRGHEAIRTALGRALDEDRLASTLLFHGPSGVGKLTTALALLRALLCPQGEPDSCGPCAVCRRLAASALGHPDVLILWPRPRGEDGSEGSVEESPAAPDLHALQEEFRRHPAWRILVDPVRQAVSRLNLSPSLGRRRVLLLLGAERLAEESGNALLKTLEEPPGSALILLLCESPSALLPTIRSRCQAFRFGPLPRAVVRQLLQERLSLEEAVAHRLSALCGGRFGAALTLAVQWEGYQARRATLTATVSEIRREKTAAAALAGAGSLQPPEVGTPDDLSILMDLLRDTMVSECHCDPELLGDPSAADRGPVPGLTAGEAAALLVRVERTREDFRRHVNRQIALDTLCLDLARPPSLSDSRE